MRKRIIMEMYYGRKQYKVRVLKEIALLLVYLFSMLCSSPTFCVLALVMLICRSDDEKEGFPEIVNFLPVENEELKRYVLKKTYGVSGIITLLLFVSYVYIALYSNHWRDSQRLLELGSGQVVSFFFFAHLSALINEATKRSRMKAENYARLHMTKKDGVSLSIFLVVFVALFFWCSIGTFRVADAVYESMSVSWMERVVLWIFLLILFLTYRVIKDSILKTLIYSDYNTKISKDEEVDYEY